MPLCLSDSVFLSPPGLEASKALFKIAWQIMLTQAFMETDERGLKGTRYFSKVFTVEYQGNIIVIAMLISNHWF